MAIGLIKFRSGKKGKGVSHYNYVMHEKKYKSKDTDQDKAVYKSSGNMPSWAKDDPYKFWQMGDKYERDNGTSYQEHILTLARELTLEQQIKKVEDWIDKKIGDKHPYSYAIHYKIGKDGKLQPHAHLFWSERTLDGIERTPEQFFRRYNKKNPEKGGCQKASLGMNKYQLKKFGQELSKEWRQHVNKHLEINGIDTRIDELSNREKGLAPKQAISYIDMQKPEVEQAYIEMLQARAELEQSEHELSLIDWDSELSKLEQQTQPVINAPVVLVEKSDKASEQTPPTASPVEPVAKPRTAQAYLDQLNAQLGKTVAPVEQPQTTPEPEPQPEPQPQPERDPHALIQEYDKKRHSLAERFFKTELKALATKLNGLVQKYKDLQASKPRFFGKDKWQDDVTATKTEHTATKATYDTVKNGGITITHFQKATDYLTKHEQDFCNQVDQARQSLIDQARQRELERQQAKATTHRPEPSVDSLVRSDRVIEQPEPPLAPEPSIERLELVSIDPRLRYDTRKGLEQIKAHIEAMPSGERQNLAISEFNKVVVEQLEQQQSQKQSPER